ncbi:hypothetical protein [Pedobacter sp. JY14-1]|uniref:hypothetical protein n=1 Tax=Pedobacter sp. JY14-1 TaxID=3034151 RepID=UPI0023E1E3C9|nr:hypothetical protein [Pedobacter sp. JY14-1]
MKRRICQQCGTQLRGRTDKKYCNERCRARSRYLFRKQQATNPVRLIDARLKQNRNMLSNLLSQGIHQVSKAQLQSGGFDFTFYTSIKHECPESLSIYCYDFGYSIVDDINIRIFEVTALPVLV